MTTTEALSQTTRDFVSRTHGMLIGGEWVPAASGETFETLDPATGSPIASVPAAGVEDIDRAVAAARKAFDEGSAWRSAPAPQRALLIHRLADLIEAHAAELAEIESLDNGKPVKLAKAVDVAGTVAHFRYFAGWPTKI